VTNKVTRSRAFARRHRIAAGLVSVMTSAFCSSAFAQDYPGRPIRIIVPLAEAGASGLVPKKGNDKMDASRAAGRHHCGMNEEEIFAWVGIVSSAF
jgi:hypothetical protein